jgi:hypothetical protein
VFGVSAFALAGCLDLAHTNPFDPETKVDIQLTGPESATNLQQIITYSVTSNPQWPGAVQWRSTNEALLHSLGDGQFGVVGIAAPPNDTASVVVLLGTHVATSRVVVAQQLTGFTFACGGATSPCVFQSGQPRSISFEGHDGNGFRMVLPYSVQVSSRQPGVLRIDSSPGPGVTFTVNVSPLTVGTSHFVASALGVRDSILVTVR